MMEDIAAHILDIAGNSIDAKTNKIDIEIYDSHSNNILSITIDDDGKGMSEEVLNKVLSPFYSSRKTRNIGLGLPFLQDLAKFLNGKFEIKSKEHIGTKVVVSVQNDHIDCPPMGDLGECMMMLIQSNCDIHYTLKYKNDQNEFIFDTLEIIEILGDVSLNETSILLWIKDYINENIKNMKEE